MRTVQFERVGRNKNIPTLLVSANDAIGIACAISDYCAPFIRSSDYDVGVNDDLSGGHIISGFHELGTFTIASANFRSMKV